MLYQPDNRQSGYLQKPVTFKRHLSQLIILAALLMALTQSVIASTVAFDMVGSASQNLTSFTNAFNGAFSSAGDGFQKYQRGVSSSIPFSVLDDSLSIFTSDSLGIIKEGNTDVFLVW
jgi:hypothetical protein